MIQFCYRAKNENGEFQTYKSKTLFKSVKDFMVKSSKNDDFCEWLEQEHVVCYFVEVSGEGAATRKCPLE